MYSDYWEDLDELVALVMQNKAEQVIDSDRVWKF